MDNWVVCTLVPILLDRYEYFLVSFVLSAQPVRPTQSFVCAASQLRWWQSPNRGCTSCRSPRVSYSPFVERYAWPPFWWRNILLTNTNDPDIRPSRASPLPEPQCLRWTWRWVWGSDSKVVGHNHRSDSDKGMLDRHRLLRSSWMVLKSWMIHTTWTGS